MLTTSTVHSEVIYRLRLILALHINKAIGLVVTERYVNVAIDVVVTERYGSLQWLLIDSFLKLNWIS